MASPQYYLFALYAKLDELASKSPEIAAKVEDYLPGTTGLGQRGWSEAIKTFLGDLCSELAGNLPSVDEALKTLTGENAQSAVSGENAQSAVSGENAQSAVSGENAQPATAAADSELGTQAPRLTADQRAGLTYVVGALQHLPIEKSEETQLLFQKALSLARPDYGEPEFSPRAPGGEDLGRILQKHFLAREDFAAALDKAKALRLVSDAVEEVGAPCTGYVEQIGGEECAVISSNIRRSGVTLGQVLEIVDPRNWQHCHGDFFCKMEKLDPEEDTHGFSRVLEHVSIVDCKLEECQIKTALKYWKGQFPPGETKDKVFTAYINYDLDDLYDDRKKAGDSGLVEVDNGTIYMTRDGDGVRIHSTKHAKLQGMSVTAMAMFMCIFGWNRVGEHMLFDTALNKDDNLDWVDWQPSEEPKPIVREQLGPTIPTLPAGVRNGLVAEPLEMLAGWIEDAHEFGWGFARRWLAGKAEPGDYISFSEKYAGRMASAPSRYLARAGRRVRRPADFRSTSRNQPSGDGS